MRKTNDIIAAKTVFQMMLSAAILWMSVACPANAAPMEISETAMQRSQTPVYAPEADWVVDPGLPDKPTDATLGSAYALALLSNQTNITDTGGATYFRLITRVSSPAALQAAGTIAVQWVSGRQFMTIHHARITRGGEAIDLLQGGRKFEVIRREQNLASGILDGELTASLQIQDLRVGDTIDYAYTVETRYPVMGDNYEDVINFSGGASIDRYHFRIRWPSARAVHIRNGNDMPAGKETRDGAFRVFEASADNFTTTGIPRDVPGRYWDQAMLQYSTFENWRQIATTFAPVYAEKSVLPADSPLQPRIAEIRAATQSDVERAEQALHLVQSEVRYVGNFGGLGGYVPVSAADVWDSRYGDCKGKTVLLVAILHALGIEAEPALVSTKWSNSLDKALPMALRFDHVIARVVIEGRIYWLDGTRLDDSNIATLSPPFTDFALPITATSDIVPLPEKRYAVAQNETVTSLDARAGWESPVPFEIRSISRGDAATTLRAQLQAMTEAQKSDMVAQIIKNNADDKDSNVTITSITFEDAPELGQITAVSKGVKKLDWGSASDLRELEIDDSRMGLDFYYERKQKGFEKMPFLSTPQYTIKRQEILLPNQSDAFRIDGDDINTQVGPARYMRTASIADGVFKSAATTVVTGMEMSNAEAKEYDEKTDALYEKQLFVYAYLNGDTGSARKNRFAATVDDAQQRQKSGDPAGALDLINAAIKGAPNNAELLMGRAKLLRDSDIAAAERDIHRILLNDYNDISALRLGAEILQQEGSDDLAEKFVKRILANEDDDIWAKAWLSNYKARITSGADGKTDAVMTGN